MNKKIAIGLTGSFCNHPTCLKVLENFHALGYEVIYFLTPNVESTDTRFGTATKLKEVLEKMSGRRVVVSIPETEILVNQKAVNEMLIMPCSATTLGKLANGIYDNAVLMCAKSLLRNEFPITLAIATNDALGISGVNIMRLLSTKNIFFVPFGQDDYVRKPNSLVCDFGKAIPSVELAREKKQIQPLLLGAKGENYE